MKLKILFYTIILFGCFIASCLSCYAQFVVAKDSSCVAPYEAYVQPIEQEAEQRYYIDKYKHKAFQADTLDSLLSETFDRIDTVFMVDSAKDSTNKQLLYNCEKSLHESAEINHSLAMKIQKKENAIRIWRGVSIAVGVLFLGFLI